MTRQHHKVEQNTEQWYKLRAGLFTSSPVKNILMGSTTSGYQTYIKQIAVERATGIPTEGFQSYYMERGHLLEDYARSYYQAETFNVVTDGGFWTYGDDMGSSPDGLVGDKGLIEIKCPKYNTMVDYLLKDKIPTDYYKQMQHQLLVTGREFCDFVAYYPGLRLMIKTVYPDPKMQNEIEEAVKIAVDAVNEIIPMIKIES